MTRHHRSHATPAHRREHDACGVGFVARATGERSHEIVRMALEAVARVAHRGAASIDNSGDGAGVLTQLPTRLFYREAYRLGLGLQPGQPFAVGFLFMPPGHDPLLEASDMVEAAIDAILGAVFGVVSASMARALAEGGAAPEYPESVRELVEHVLDRLRAGLGAPS